jgi:hypothetical protein
MVTSNSSRVRFMGQGPLPEFDYSQRPLPDNIRVLLWMLDGAERRHHLARSWRATDDLHVEVEGGEVIVTLPGTRYAVMYYKPGELSTASWQEFPRGGRSTISDFASGIRRKSLEGRQ